MKITIRSARFEHLAALIKEADYKPDFETLAEGGELNKRIRQHVNVNPDEANLLGEMADKVFEDWDQLQSKTDDGDGPNQFPMIFQINIVDDGECLGAICASVAENGDTDCELKSLDEAEAIYRGNFGIGGAERTTGTWSRGYMHSDTARHCLGFAYQYCHDNPGCRIHIEHMPHHPNKPLL